MMPRRLLTYVAVALVAFMGACQETSAVPIETQQPPDVTVAQCVLTEVSSLALESLTFVRYEGEVLVGVAETNLAQALQTLDGSLLDFDPALEVAKVNLNTPWHAPLPDVVRFMEVEQFDWVKHAEPLEILQWQFQVLDTPSEVSGEGVVIAISDDGIQGDHPDLRGRMVPGFDPLSGDILTPNTNYAGKDDFHGTHTAGLALARINGEGGRGLAHNARLMPLLVFDEDGFVGQFRAARAIRWAADNGADIISASWGGGGYSPTLYEAITYALVRDVVVVASAGNAGQFDSTYPSSYPGVIRVGATTPDNQRAWFSSYGDTLSLMAPGIEMLSTIPGDDYGYLSGTSMATPLVAGAAALALERYPAWTPYQVKYALMASATDMAAPGWDLQTGAGLLNPVDVIKQTPPLGATLTLRNFAANAEVSVQADSPRPGERLVARTDDDGNVTFVGITPGDYRLSVVGRELEASSYQLAEGSVSVVVGDNTCNASAAGQ
jgi:subtilisin family serine protease